jgi:hypothetical protein
MPVPDDLVLLDVLWDLARFMYACTLFFEILENCLDLLSDLCVLVDLGLEILEDGWIDHTEPTLCHDVCLEVSVW